MKFTANGFTVDLSKVERRDGVDASRWAGKVTLTSDDGCVVTANWKGAEGASDGMLYDVEGEVERLCEIVDLLSLRLADEISKQLGDPCSSEERRELARLGWYDAA